MIKVSPICSRFVLRTASVSVRKQARPRGPPGFALIRLLLRRNLQHRPGAAARLLRISRHARARVRGRSGGSRRPAVDRRARGRRNQSGLRKMRLVRARAGAPLPHAHRARNRQTSRRISRISDSAGAQSASRSARDFHPRKPCLSNRWRRPAKFWIRCASRAARPSPCWAMESSGCLRARFCMRTAPKCISSDGTPTNCGSPRQVGVNTEIANKLPVAKYEFVVDATGSSEGLRQAVQMTQPRGTMIMKSTVHGLVAIDTAPVIVNEITLVGSRCGRFEPALASAQEPQVRVDAMISEVLPLKDAPRAFRAAAKPGVLKVLLHA